MLKFDHAPERCLNTFLIYALLTDSFMSLRMLVLDPEQKNHIEPSIRER